MHRIDSDASVNGLFSAGNPASGQPGTVVSPEWLNAIQEEIAGLIEAMGGTLAKADNTQLAAAVLALLARVSTWTARQTFSDGVTVGSGNDAADLTNGGLELTSANALIDFKDLSSEDYDARIIKPSGQNLQVVGTPLIVPTPVGSGDAVTKGYVDARFVVAAFLAADGTIISQTGSGVLSLQNHPQAGNYYYALAGATNNAIVLMNARLQPISSAVAATAWGSTNSIGVIITQNGAGTDAQFSLLVLKL